MKKRKKEKIQSVVLPAFCVLFPPHIPTQPLRHSDPFEAPSDPLFTIAAARRGPEARGYSTGRAEVDNELASSSFPYLHAHCISAVRLWNQFGNEFNKPDIT